MKSITREGSLLRGHKESPYLELDGRMWKVIVLRKTLVASSLIRLPKSQLRHSELRKHVIPTCGNTSFRLAETIRKENQPSLAREREDFDLLGGGVLVLFDSNSYRFAPIRFKKCISRAKRC